MHVSAFVNNILFPRTNLWKSAEAVVRCLGEESKYYDLLLQQTNLNKKQKIQFLVNHWRSQGKRASDLFTEVRQFYKEKEIVKKEENIEYVAAEEDFECFRIFDKRYDLKPLNQVYAFNIKSLCFGIVSGKIEDLFKSETDNFGGHHLNLYCWTRTASWDTDYTDDEIGFKNLPATAFNRKVILLNIQKYVMETYYDKVILKMFVVNLHPDNEEYQIREAFVFPDVKDLFVKEESNIPVAVKEEPGAAGNDKTNETKDVKIEEVKQEELNMVKIKNEPVNEKKEKIDVEEKLFKIKEESKDLDSDDEKDIKLEKIKSTKEELKAAKKRAKDDLADKEADYKTNKKSRK